MEVSEITSARYGVLVIRITTLDDSGHPVYPQPPGSYQVWAVIGETKMLHAVSSPQEAASWMVAEDLRQLSVDEIPSDFFESGFSSEKTATEGETDPCVVDLVEVTQTGEQMLSRQLMQRHWRCIRYEHPVIISGFGFDHSSKSGPPPRSGRGPR